MGLSNDLISQFVEVTNKDEKPKNKTSTVYGTVMQVGDQIYVQFDGSNTTTPVSSTVKVNVNDRVVVTIKNHTAMITGNLKDPSASSADVNGAVSTANNASNKVDQKISEFEVAIADRITTEQLNAAKVDVTKTLTAQDAVIRDELKASIVHVYNKLTAEDAEIEGKLEADEAEITNLKTNKLDAEFARNTYATIVNLTSTNTEVNNLKATHSEFVNATAKNFETVNANITKLDTEKLDAETAKVTYANIDFSNIGKAAIEQFFSKSGMIDNLVVGDSTVTGELVGVTISGDLIKANTVKADKLVVKGSDGIYYKLNIDAGATTSAEVTENDLQNGLHGSAIIAKTITAEKISVKDLVAFGADIAGFHITEQNTFYSGAKSSVNNTTQGIYMDATGQMNIGDGSNFMKYYKAADGSYKLEISANSIILSSSGKTVENVIDDITIGGRNLLPNTDFGGSSMRHERLEDTLSERGFHFYPTVQIESGVEYTLSARIRGNTNVVFFEINEGGNVKHIWISKSSGLLSETEYKHFSITFTVSDDKVFKDVYICTLWGDENTPIGDWFEIEPKSLKLELGNKPTDWSPAPEDLATAEEVDKAQSTASEADTKASDAQALIAQLADSISMLVTDGNGTSLMTQTEDGWTFSTATIQDLVNKVSDNLNTLTEDVGEVNGTVDLIKQAVNDLEEIAEYVKVTTYEDEPCIELGEADSEFKLRITNTRMMFTEGSTTLAYFTNQAFNSKKVVIEEELQQGGFVWKVRSNGNLGLTWKGGNS